MSGRIRISSGNVYEARIGFSRAVRIGPHVWVAGTAAIDEQGNLVGPGDAYAQAAFILRKIGKALEQAGSSLADVVRTRMFVTDISHQDAVGRAHAEVFGGIRPVATMVAVTALVAPAMLVEIEVEAYAG